MTFEHLNFTR